jgi:sterol desaturase/sphingolipid hydroxylase (fatty acid hydroxylase superfamily)
MVFRPNLIHLLASLLTLVFVDAAFLLMTAQLFSIPLTVLKLSIWFVLLFLIFLPIERVFPRHSQPIIRQNYWQDCFYYFLNGILPKLLLVLPLSLLASFLHRFGSNPLFEWAASLSVAQRLMLALLVGDLGAYWGHRWSHQQPFLWKFHSVHHSAPQLDWLVNSRAHPIDMVFTRLCGLVPLYVLGLAQPTATTADLTPLIYSIFANFWSFMVHANINLRLGFLEKLVSSPAFHHWHHTNQHPRLINKNYAAIFPFYDMIFGSYFLPSRKWPKSYGLLAETSTSSRSGSGHPLTSASLIS